MQIAEIKRKLRALRKIKKDLRVGTDYRKQVLQQIRELKQSLKELTDPDTAKQALIKKIVEIRKMPMLIDLRNYTNEQLALHLERLQNGKLAL